MKKEIALFDLCPIREGKRNAETVCITAMSYLKEGADNEQRMEEQLLNVSEYILLRGKSNHSGLLRTVNTVSAHEMDEDALMKLYLSLHREYRRNAVFMMNFVTLHQLYRTIGFGNGTLLRSDSSGGFLLLNRPIVLCNSMPCPKEGDVPILYGDFGKVHIEDCGRDALQQEPHDDASDQMKCRMTGYLNCVLDDRQAVWGMKMV